jgi:hypothetical protein
MRWRCRDWGSSRARAVISAWPGQARRRSTASSCRNINILTPFAAENRHSRASHAQIGAVIR